MNKKCLIISVAIIAITIFGACKDKNTGNFPGEENFDKDASYAMGMNLGARMREGMLADGIILNLDEFLKGMKDGFSGQETRFDIEEAMDRIETAFSAIQEEKNAPLIQQETEFLTQNAKKPGIKIMPSGLQYEVLTDSNGPRPSLDDRVQMNYEGRLTDGYLFDSTFEYGRPLEVTVSEVFSGWSEGLQLMTVGSTYKFYIPSEIAFGPEGYGPIPPYATLIFTVELLEIL